MQNFDGCKILIQTITQKVTHLTNLLKSTIFNCCNGYHCDLERTRSMKLLQIGKAQISIITYATNAIMQSVSLTLTEPTDIPVLTFLSQPASQPNTHE